MNAHYALPQCIFTSGRLVVTINETSSPLQELFDFVWLHAAALRESSGTGGQKLLHRNNGIKLLGSTFATSLSRNCCSPHT
eukprot:1285667-Amphidinium_carterae.1